MDTELLITLQNYGLSDKEAKVYLTILELGTSIASTIARRAGINRVTVYTILGKLKKEGIVNEIEKEGIKYYSVIGPDALLKQIEQKYESFKEKVPELLAMAEKFGTKPKLTFYEGINGLKNLYNKLLDHDQEIFAFLSDDEIDPEIDKYLNEVFVNIRKEKGIKVSVIVSDKEKDYSYLKSVEKDKLTKIKFAKGDLVGIKGEIILFGEDSVACSLYGKDELVGYIIKSKQFYDSMKSIFMFVRNNL